MFSKMGNARHISHLDLQRTMERALRRAGIEVSYSQGFNPKPRFSIASALMLGAEADNEVMDCHLNSGMCTEEFVRRMNCSLPEGIRFKRARVLAETSRDCAAASDAARYRISLPGFADRLLELTSAFISAPSVVIEKTTKSKTKRIDVKPLVVAIRMPVPDSVEILLDISGPSIRPPEFVGALLSLGDAPVPDRIDYRRLDILTCIEGHYVPLFEADV